MFFLLEKLGEFLRLSTRNVGCGTQYQEKLYVTRTRTLH